MACRKRSISEATRRCAGRRALIDGEAGAVWAVGGAVRSAFLFMIQFMIQQDRIAEVEIVMDPARLAELDVTIG